MGYLYQIHGLPPHSYRADDLKAWNCNKAAQLLQEASSKTTWIYLDASAGQGLFGSAVTIYNPNGTVLVLCLAAPDHSSERSEYWAGTMLPWWVSSLNQPMQCIILGDNKQVIRTANTQSYVMASRSSHGTWHMAWPAPFNQVASIWWAQCSHPGDNQNFVKLLVPSTLYETMITPTTGKTKPQRVLSFKNALPQRQRKFKDALSRALTWLAEDPPPLPRPPPPRSQHLGQTKQHLQHVTHPTGA